jgi:hypothetical protein
VNPFTAIYNWILGKRAMPEPLQSPPGVTPVNPAIDVLARTLWGEARGEGLPGMHAVANIICTRASNPRWWGTEIASVCTKPYQFSCWNASDPNRNKLLAVTRADPEFQIALNLAELAVKGLLPDTTRGSDSYYALSMPIPPPWATEAAFRNCRPWWPEEQVRSWGCRTRPAYQRAFCRPRKPGALRLGSFRGRLFIFGQIRLVAPAASCTIWTTADFVTSAPPLHLTWRAIAAKPAVINYRPIAWHLATRFR